MRENTPVPATFPRNCDPRPSHIKRTVRPMRSFWKISERCIGKVQKAGRLRLHTPAALAELAVLTGPTEIGKEAFAIDRLEDLLNPSSETIEVLWRFVEIDLLESGRLRFDQNVISDQGFRI